ncbi:MAG: hypothetical protein WDN24_05675 [Sphingomonas sp.]
MRGFLVLIGLLALIAVVLMALGMLKIEKPNEGMLPNISFDIEGGRLPEVKTGTIDVGTTNATVSLPSVEMKNTTVTLPTIEVKQAGNSTAPATKQ